MKALVERAVSLRIGHQVEDVTQRDFRLVLLQDGTFGIDSAPGNT